MMLAMIVLATTCVTMPPQGAEFFVHSEAVFFGRWTKEQRFVVENVVRGRTRRGQSVPAATDVCNRAEVGKRYLVSRNCWGNACYARWADAEYDAPRLLAYLRAAHRETHESVLKKTLRWREGKMPLDAYGRWIETAAVERRSDKEDAFLLRLIDELRALVFELQRMPPSASVEEELRVVDTLVRAFPRGTPEQWDARLDAADDFESDARSDYDAELLSAIRTARQKAFTSR